MKAAYKTLAKYYDLIFQGKNYLAESRFIKEMVGQRMPKAKSILDVGCGTGTHLNLLINDFEVLYGVDLNPEVLKEAKKKSPKANYVVGGMADFDLGRKFDVITCLFSVFNYNLTVKEARKTLRNIKKHLNPRGLVIFALYTPHNTDKEISLHVGKNPDVEVAKINQYFFDPRTHLEICDFLVLVKDKEKIDFYTELRHKYRIYEVDEFTNLLTEAGFVDIAAFDNFTDKPASPEAKYPVVIASLEW